MDFSFSEEQTMLVDSVQRFIQNDYDFDSRQKLIATEQGFSPENWRNFAELGWLAAVPGRGRRLRRRCSRHDDSV